MGFNSGFKGLIYFSTSLVYLLFVSRVGLLTSLCRESGFLNCKNRGIF